MPVETWLICILIFMIIGSIVALEMRDILSAIISIGIVGLGVSTAFLFLQAPDLAIVQFLFEIFAMIILLRAFMHKEYHQQEPSTVGYLLTGVTVAVLVLIFIMSMPVFQLLPPFGQPLLSTAERYLEQGAQETGA
ncbi:MAG TPA: hydrogenase subunit MbhD domain-containing protein, partial [bacterium]|nr:hydrogenase subunit MbhD domain-containing protein [bacterium]